MSSLEQNKADAFANEDARKLDEDKGIDKNAAQLDSLNHPHNSPQVEGEAGSTQFLFNLTKWHPFMGFFLFLADCSFPKTMPAHERVRGMRTSHPWIFWVAVVLDTIVLILILWLLGYISFHIARAALNG